jgi:hypothetical protein
MRILAVVAALVPLLTLPAMAERAAVDKCKSDADKAIAALNERMRVGNNADDGASLQKQQQEATEKRAACDKNSSDPPAS